MKKGPKLTMAPIVAQAEADPPARPDPNEEPGHFNQLGQLFDPQGRRLQRSKSAITPNQARTLVENGAELASKVAAVGAGAAANPHGSNRVSER